MWGQVFVLLGERAQQKCVGQNMLGGWCNMCVGLFFFFAGMGGRCNVCAG